MQLKPGGKSILILAPRGASSPCCHPVVRVPVSLASCLLVSHALQSLPPIQGPLLLFFKTTYSHGLTPSSLSPLDPRQAQQTQSPVWLSFISDLYAVLFYNDHTQQYWGSPRCGYKRGHTQALGWYCSGGRRVTTHPQDPQKACAPGLGAGSVFTHYFPPVLSPDCFS